MKNTGIIRKIDDLGRIVIPKELRKNLNFDSGDDIEIFIEQDKVILKKIDVIESLKKQTDRLISSLYDIIDCEIYITDKEKVVTSGKLYNFELPELLKKLLQERKKYISNCDETMSFNNVELSGYFIISPIIHDSNTYGLLIIYKNEKLTNEDIFISKLLKNIIENKQIL